VNVVTDRSDCSSIQNPVGIVKEEVGM